MNIGENIKKYRKKNGLTQQQLADLSGISKNAIYNYENNKRVPSIEITKNIAAALSIPVDILFSNELKPLLDDDLFEDGFEDSKGNKYTNINTFIKSNLFENRQQIDFLQDSLIFLLDYIDRSDYALKLDDETFFYLLDKICDTLEFELFKLDKNKNIANDETLENEESIMYDIGNGKFIPSKYSPDYLNNQLNKPRKLNNVEKKLIDRFGVGKGMHNRKKPDLKQTDK